MKRFNVQYNVGKVKYVVNHFDGKQKHADGSDFFDIAIFKNKKDLRLFVNKLCSNGYREG